jgi:DNA-binding transcriptional ArsR family regulator
MEPSAQPISLARSFDWEALVPLLVHPVKVEIIEAMSWIEAPLSATDLDRILVGRIGVSLISYHLRKLAELGAIEKVRQEMVRGAVQTFYALPGYSSS